MVPRRRVWRPRRVRRDRGTGRRPVFGHEVLGGWWVSCGGTNPVGVRRIDDRELDAIGSV